jgi:tetratricopeptide (TPR) repeat protein
MTNATSSDRARRDRFIGASHRKYAPSRFHLRFRHAVDRGHTDKFIVDNGNNTDLRRELSESLEQQTATSDVLPIQEQILGQEHPDVAHTLNNLANVCNEQGRYADAEPLHKRSLAIREKVLGLEHPDVASSLNSLANLYEDQGRYADAEPLYKRSLAIREKALGLEHADVAQALSNLASLYEDQPISRR